LIKISQASRKGDKKKKNKLKENLFSFTPAVMIPKGDKRRLVNVKHFTGLMQMDFDDIDSEEMAIDMKQDLFNHCDAIICAYLSPSRKGVKCLLRTVIPKNLDQFKRLHLGMVKEFECYDHLDLATKNAVLPLYLSHDKDILFRDFNKCKLWGVEIEEEKYVQPSSYKPVQYTGMIERHYHHKTTRIFESKVNMISSNGHPQLRDACLVLGTRVGAGYISQGEAEQLSEHMIKTNNYLKKGVYGYIKTSKWAIQKGSETPKEYKTDFN